jgi:hypothetical protein
MISRPEKTFWIRIVADFAFNNSFRLITLGNILFKVSQPYLEGNGYIRAVRFWGKLPPESCLL